MSSVIVCNTSLFYDYNVKTQSKFDKKKIKKNELYARTCTIELMYTC